MKFQYQSATIILFLFAVGCSSRPSEQTVNRLAVNLPKENSEWMVFVSEGLDEATLRDLRTEVQNLLITVTAPGDVVHLLSAPEHKPIATVVIPPAATTRERVRKIKGELAQIKVVLASRPGSQQVQLPRVPATVNSLRRTDLPLKIVLIGDPVYHDKRQKGWSFEKGYVPTHQSLFDSTCPFGMGVRDFPPDCKLSWLTPSATWGVDHIHQEAITEFFQLFCREHQGRLCKVTADTAAAFAFDGELLAADHLVFDKQSPPRMKLVTLASTRDQIGPLVNEVGYEVRARTVTGSSVSDREAPPNSIDVPDDIASILETAQANQDTITVAMNWESDDPNCDLDLRIKDSRHQSEELSYKNKRTSFGQLLRDITASGIVAADQLHKWEVAEINHDILPALDVWINVFKTSKPSRVRLILVWKGMRAEKSFPIDATSGDGGQRRRTGEAWKQLSLLEFFTPANAGD